MRGCLGRKVAYEKRHECKGIAPAHRYRVFGVRVQHVGIHAHCIACGYCCGFPGERIAGGYSHHRLRMGCLHSFAAVDGLCLSFRFSQSFAWPCCLIWNVPGSFCVGAGVLDAYGRSYRGCLRPCGVLVHRISCGGACGSRRASVPGAFRHRHRVFGRDDLRIAAWPRCGPCPWMAHDVSLHRRCFLRSSGVSCRGLSEGSCG